MIEVLPSNGFNLTEFKSNSPNVLDSLPSDKHERSPKQTEIDQELVEQTLEVSWWIHNDCFTFTKSINHDKTRNTQYSQFKLRSTSIFGTIHFES